MLSEFRQGTSVYEVVKDFLVPEKSWEKLIAATDLGEQVLLFM